MPTIKKNKQSNEKIDPTEVEKEKKDKENKIGVKIKKYKSIKSSINDGTFLKFEDLFSIVSPTVMRTDININYEGFKNRQYNPGSFTLDEMIRLADMVGIDVNDIIKLILNQIDYKTRKDTILIDQNK